MPVSFDTGIVVYGLLQDCLRSMGLDAVQMAMVGCELGDLLKRVTELPGEAE